MSTHDSKYIHEVNGTAVAGEFVTAACIYVSDFLFITISSLEAGNTNLQIQYKTS